MTPQRYDGSDMDAESPAWVWTVGKMHIIMLHTVAALSSQRVLIWYSAMFSPTMQRRHSPRYSPSQRVSLPIGREDGRRRCRGAGNLLHSCPFPCSRSSSV